MASKESSLIKEILEEFAMEKQSFLMFIIEKKLDGEFFKWSSERMKKLSQLDNKYNFGGNNESDNISS